MSCPLSSIVNPLNPSEVLLFYLLEQGTVGLERHDYTSGTDRATKFSDNGVATVDVIANPGSFSTLVCNGLLNVYGLVKEPLVTPAGTTATAAPKATVDANKPKRIAQLSPVFKLLSSEDFAKAQGIALTTTVDDEGIGYLYSIDAKAIPLTISEIKIGWDSSAVSNTISVNQPLLATNLAAAFDPKEKKRLVVYQNKSMIRIVDHANTSDDAIPNTQDSQDSTGLALVTKTTATGIKLYLYYFSSKGAALQRVVRDENKQWGPSSAVPGAKVAEKTTFLSGTLVKNKIVLFYMAEDDKESIYRCEDTP